MVAKGSILIAMYGATVGKTAILGIDATTNQAVCNIQPDEKIAESRFIWYCLRYKLPELLNKRFGGAQPNISQQIIRNTKIPIPPLSEQRRIVEILDQANSLRKLRVEANAKAERILPALFYRMFGDPINLINNKKSIELGKLNIDLRNGFACGKKDVERGLPHLRMNNIDDFGLLNLDLVRTVPSNFNKSTYQLKNGDILFMGTNSEEKIGKACVFYRPDNKDYLFSNHLIRIKINDGFISPEYLSTYLHLLWRKRFYPSIAKRWVNQATVSIHSLKKLKIFLPNKDDIKKFTESFKLILQQRDWRLKESTKLNILFEVFLNSAFSGDLTAAFRRAHMKELLTEMEQQQKYLSEKINSTKE